MFDKMMSLSALYFANFVFSC